MALNIKPLSDRVLIEPVAAETKNCFRDSRYSKRKPQKGTVVVGNGTKEHNDCENWILFFMENMLELN
jgi:chaperonin GroES